MGDWLQWTIRKGSSRISSEVLKWLLGVNKCCNNNACRAETGRFPMWIEAQCRNFKFWLPLTKKENKLSQIAYNDIKWDELIKLAGGKNSKLLGLLEQIGLGVKSGLKHADIGNVHMTRQRLKDIKLQKWLSEINNDTTKDANQSNKMKPSGYSKR